MDFAPRGAPPDAQLRIGNDGAANTGENRLKMSQETHWTVFIQRVNFSPDNT
jgi:hypothetical protein